MSSSPVTLFVYDLSQGMARMLSPMLGGGMQLDGIWHTSVVVYGTEWFFGQGIMSARPGQTMHGTPVERIPMGTTHLPQEVVKEYIDNMRPIWTAEKYHLLDNNCNSFTDEVCQFLVGKSIPSHITGLPADFLNTPLGQQIRPMIESMFGPSRHASAASHTPLPASSMASSTGVPSLTVDTSAGPAAVIETRSFAELNTLIGSRKAVAAFFTREGCGPCKMIEPELKNLVQEINSSYVQAGARRKGQKDLFLTAARVDTGVAFDAASHFKITATPTFMLFQDGKKFYEFKGANAGELKMALYNLVGNTFPAHKHGKVSIPVLTQLGSVPHTYPPVSEPAKLFAKLKQFAVDEAKVITASEWDSVMPGLLICLETGGTPPDGSRVFFEKCISLDRDRIFPALDLLRMLIDKSKVVREWATEANPAPIMRRMRELGVDAETPKAARLTLLKLACHLPSNLVFSASRMLPPVLKGEPEVPFRTITTAMLVESLLHSDASVRQSAAGLAWNAALAEAGTREGSGVPASLALDFGQETEEEHEEWVLELVSAVSTSLEREKESDEVRLRLLGALVHLVRFAGTAVGELVWVLNVCDQLEAEMKALAVTGGDAKAADRRKKITGLLKELAQLTQA